MKLLQLSMIHFILTFSTPNTQTMNIDISWLDAQTNDVFLLSHTLSETAPYA
jgi:hypothetical protein